MSTNCILYPASVTAIFILSSAAVSATYNLSPAAVSATLPVPCSCVWNLYLIPCCCFCLLYPIRCCCVLPVPYPLLLYLLHVSISCCYICYWYLLSLLTVNYPLLLQLLYLYLFPVAVAYTCIISSAAVPAIFILFSAAVLDSVLHIPSCCLSSVSSPRYCICCIC
jgi:hypothetical protein